MTAITQVVVFCLISGILFVDTGAIHRRKIREIFLRWDFEENLLTT